MEFLAGATSGVKIQDVGLPLVIVRAIGHLFNPKTVPLVKVSQARRQCLPVIMG
jgi:hypothetical protein